MSKKHSTEFEVALLIEDMNEAKQVSDALREMGIYAHYHCDLDDFWVATKTQTPDFAIVDVKRMSQGSTLFKNHPKVQDGSLAFAFYYSDATKVLVNSTFQLNHYGLVKKELNLLGQLKAALRRRNEELRLDSEKRILEERISRLQKRSNRILRDSQVGFNFHTQFQSMMEMTSRIGVATSEEDFLARLMGALSDWDACMGYGIYALDGAKQKLVAPKTIRSKFKSLPDLWLTRPAERGIDSYAQEMACEVAFDFFDNDARAVNIRGFHANPDILIVGKFDETTLRDFPWNLLEERLGASYLRLLANEEDSGNSHSAATSVWEALSYMDDMHFHQAPGMHKIADISLSGLLEVIAQNPANRFFWKSFSLDFGRFLENTLSGNFKVSSFGASNFLVFIEKTRLEEDYQKLKASLEDFPFHNYFQDPSVVMSSRTRPSLRLVPPSALNYLRSIEPDFLAKETDAVETLRKGFVRPSLDA